MRSTSLGRLGHVFWFAAVGGALMTWACCSSPSPQMPVTASTNPRHAADLFRRHCALCHGPDGAGDGPAAAFLFPPTRDFGDGQFRLVSTDNGMPTDADLVGVLARGMPGSAMPSFAWLKQHELIALAGYVRQLAVTQKAQRLEDGGASADAALRYARRAFTPGQPLALVAAGTTPASSAARGRELYLEHCATCHGREGKGSRPTSPWNDSGAYQWARDFTQGILKGSVSRQDLVCRIRGGLPGTTMTPAAIEDPADIIALADYVATLVPPGAENRLVQRPKAITAHRIGANLPSLPDDAAWLDAVPRHVVLAPTHWRDGAITEATITAVHNGEAIALRVRWPDATRDDRPLSSAPAADAVAIQFADHPRPQIFAMGSREQPVHIWYWKPYDPATVSALLDRQTLPHGAATADVSSYVPALPAAAHATRLEGIASTARIAGQSAVIAAEAQWHDGEWSVVFVRSLEPRTADEFRLAPGGEIQVGLAIWDGTTRTGDADKSFSIWHRLELGR